jgi:hypothetical protein
MFFSSGEIKKLFQQQQKQKKCGDSNWKNTIPLELNGKLDRTLNH